MHRPRRKAAVSLPHVCECRICGTTFPLGSVAGDVAATYNSLVHEPLIVPEGTISAPPLPVPVCAHGFTVCKVCKFPAA